MSCNCIANNIFLDFLFRFPLKAVKVMHTVALRTESTLSSGVTPLIPTTDVQALQSFFNQVHYPSPLVLIGVIENLS